MIKNLITANVGVILTALLTLFWAMWIIHGMGYEFDKLSRAYIGNEYDTRLNAMSQKEAMDNLLYRPTDLGYSHSFYGEKNPLGLTTAPYGIAVLTLPVYLLTGQNMILTYNLYLLATFPLTAVAAHLLVRRVTSAPDTACLIAGFMVAFAQSRLYHLTRQEVLSTYFFLLTLYFLHHLVETPRPRWTVALGLTLGLGMSGAAYLTYMAALALAFYVLYRFLLNTLSRQVMLHLAGAVIIGGLIFAPTLPFRLGNETFTAGHQYDTILSNSSNVLDWFSGNTALYRFITPYRDSFGFRNTFLGFVPIILAIGGWYFYRRTDDPMLKTHLRFYSFLICLGYLLTLGPVLRLNETPLAPSPYLFFMQLPGFWALRYPPLFIILAVTGTAILSALLLRYLYEHERRYYWLTTLTALLMLMVELLPFGGGASRRIISMIIYADNGSGLAPNEFTDTAPYEWIVDQPSNPPVFHYPMQNPNATGEYYAYMVRYPHHMLNGFASYMPAWYYAPAWKTFPNPATLQFLAERDIEYVLIHEHLLSTEELERLETAVIGRLNFVGQLSHTRIYKIIPPYHFFDFERSAPGTGWHLPETAGETSFSWSAAPVFTYRLPEPTSQPMILKFRVLGAVTPPVQATLRLTIDETAIPLQASADQIFTATIPAGTAELTFTSEVIVPAEVGMNSDQRTLGIAFDWLWIGTHRDKPPG